MTSSKNPWERRAARPHLIEKCARAARFRDSFEQYLDGIYYQNVPLKFTKQWECGKLT